MTKRRRSTRQRVSGYGLLIGLGVVFVGLIALTLVQTQQIAARPTPTLLPPEAAFQRVFPELAVLDLAAIRLRNPETGGSFTMQRSEVDGTWLNADTGEPMPADEATTIARTIALLPHSETIPLEDSADLTPYGFLPLGIFSIEIVLLNEEAHFVVIGDLAPSDTAYFALVDERPEMYLLNRAAVDFLIQEYRSNRVGGES